MKFTIERATDYGEPIREVDINTMDELENLPERLSSGDYCGTFAPPYEVVICFEEGRIIIYDYYLE